MPPIPGAFCGDKNAIKQQNVCLRILTQGRDEIPNEVITQRKFIVM
jgi:hypothetical protein